MNVKKTINTKNALIFTLFIICFLFLAFAIATSIQYVNYLDKKNRIMKTIDNDIFCPDGTDKPECMLVPNLNLAIPVNVSGTYSNEIAYFGCNLIACLEFAFMHIPDNQEITTITMPTGVEILNHIYYKQTTIGLICKTIDALWVIFRGSQTIREWEKDLQIEQVVSNKFNGQIHKGFLDIYNNIQTDVHTFLAQQQQSFQYLHLYIIGYSLGSALSQLLISDSKNLLNFTYKNVYVFAAPRIGNPIFANSLSSFNIFRISNEADIVCELPPAVSPNFVNDPNNVFIYQHNLTQQTVLFNDNRSSFVENHSLKTYMTYFNS